MPDQNGWSRALHFEAAWIAVLTGLLYVISGLLTRHFRKDLVPKKADLSWRALLTLRGHAGAVTTVAWSPDGKRLATASADQTAKVWDANGKQLRTLGGDLTRSVCSVAWSPDGKRLATGSCDYITQVWDAASGQELQRNFNNSPSVAWSPDGKRLAEGRAHDTIVWDVISNEGLLALQGHNGKVLSVAWSPDGKRLATASDDETVQIYAMDIRDLMELARQRVPADPSCNYYLGDAKCPPFPKLPLW